MRYYKPLTVTLPALCYCKIHECFAMDRRIAVRNLALIISGAILLPACDRHHNKASIALKHINLDAKDESVIASVAETIIPRTDTPGAYDLQLHLFTMKMLDDCYKQEDQQSYVSGLKWFNELTQQTYHKPFVELTRQQREQWLNHLEQQNLPKSDLTNFYGTTKFLTVFGYTNSKFYLTKEVVYELVPGRYNGYYPVKNMKNHPKYA